MKAAYSWLQPLVDHLASRIERHHHPLLDQGMLDTIENHVDMVYPLVDALLDPKDSVVGVDVQEQACLILVSEVLAFIHYAILQNQSWANDFTVQFQNYLARMLINPHSNARMVQCLFDILHQSELDIIPSVRDAHTCLVESYHLRDNAHSVPPTCDSIRELLEEIAHIGTGCPYEMYENLISQHYKIMPNDVQIVMISEMAQADITTIHEAAVLMCLHPSPWVRQRVPALLARWPRKISPASLRRLIIMRNWLPCEERSAIDNLIRLTRKAGVDCEPWQKSNIIKIIATGFDGVGAQSILVLSRRERQYYLSGVLLKEQMGVLESLLFASPTLRSLEQIIREMRVKSASIPITPCYLDYALPHFLALNVQHQSPPSPLLLAFAEAVGAHAWYAHTTASSDILSQLLLDLEVKYFDDVYINRVLGKSQAWLTCKSFAESWFECDAKVEAVLRTLLTGQDAMVEQPTASCVQAVCREILEPRRDKWMARLLWMALWAKNSTRQHAPNWRDFAILAKMLADGRPIRDIPLMQAIAAQTMIIFTKGWHAQPSSAYMVARLENPGAE